MNMCLNILKHEVILNKFKNLASTSQKTYCFSIANNNLLNPVRKFFLKIPKFVDVFCG